jgi:hypothetical protein
VLSEAAREPQQQQQQQRPRGSEISVVSSADDGIAHEMQAVSGASALSVLF